MEKRSQPIGFWGYNHDSEKENEPWLEDVPLNEMITLTAGRKTASQESAREHSGQVQL